MGLLREKEIRELSQWVDSVFKNAWKLQRVKNVVDDVSSGVLLLHLTETLLSVKLPLINKNPRNFTQRLENIEMSLEAFRQDGVEMPGILAQDIAERDSDVILTLCCFLKRHYTNKISHDGIVSSRNSPTTEHSQFTEIQDETPSKLQTETEITSQTPVNNDCSSPFGHSLAQTERGVEKTRCQEYDFIPFEKEDIAVLDWVSSMTGRLVEDYYAFKDGVILCEIINSVSLRTIPQKVIDRSSSIERIKLALNTAAYELGIETELTAEDIATCRYQQSLRSFLGLLWKIHIQQIQTLRYNATSIRELGNITWNNVILDWLPDWSLVSQSEVSGETGGFPDRSGPNVSSGEKANNGEFGMRVNRRDNLRKLKQHQHGDDSTQRHTASRVSKLEKQLSEKTNKQFNGKTNTFPLTSNGTVMTDKEIVETEKRRKREILRNQLSGMQKSIDELKEKINEDKSLKSADLYAAKASKCLVQPSNCVSLDTSLSESMYSGVSDDKKSNVLGDCGLSHKKIQFKGSHGESSWEENSSNNQEIEEKYHTFERHFLENVDVKTESKVEEPFKASEKQTKHSKIEQKPTEEQKRIDGNLRKISNTSTMSASSTLSNVAHDVTRLVRLSSRRPKGSVD